VLPDRHAGDVVYARFSRLPASAKWLDQIPWVRISYVSTSTSDTSYRWAT
jgi:hypothetical protein